MPGCVMYMYKQTKTKGWNGVPIHIKFICPDVLCTCINKRRRRGGTEYPYI